MGIGMKATAEARLSSTEQLIEEAKEEARNKKMEKEVFQNAASKIRAELSQARSRLANMNSVMGEARREAEKRKEKAWLGTVRPSPIDAYAIEPEVVDI
jgi:wobble nucleotide-excising tRNase